MKRPPAPEIGKENYGPSFLKRPRSNSFDEIYQNSGVPVHRYRRDAVRKKAARKLLPGQECDCCKRFWGKQRRENGNEETQKLLDKVSKHRDKFPRPKTPPGFWDPTFPDEE